MTEVSRVMITRPNKLGIGIDVGWRLTDPDSRAECIELWTMNTRDDESLKLLVQDAKLKYGEFEIEFGHHD